VKHVLSLVAVAALLVAACSGTTASSTLLGNSPPPASSGLPPSPGDTPHGLVPSPLPPGPDVQFAGLLDPADGWAVVGQRLLITADGGSTWRDATPPGGFATAGAYPLLGVTFVDAQHGWVAVNETFTQASDASYGRVDIWRTTDRGQTWTRARLPRAVFNHYGEVMPEVQLDFLDVGHGFAFLSGNSAKGLNDSDLFWTADGGMTWSADRPTGGGSSGVEGTARFSTPADGVIVNAQRGAGIAVTHDGGRAWAEAALAVPPGSASAQLFFGQPIFFAGRSGLVFVDLQTDTTTVTQLSRVYATTDAGSSWSVATTLSTPVTAISFLDLRQWIGLNSTEVIRTGNGGQTWDRSVAVGLPSAPASVLMVDAEHGWAILPLNVCLSFKSNCESRTGLYSTVDDGKSWTALWPR
jgi:photosystem II stability/assembly factor-like uncharacterized protein